MPDAFGFETPQEAQARVRDRFLQSSRNVGALGQNATPGQRLGASLSNIFGGHVQKFIDTRSARKAHEQKLIEQGLSPEAAKAQAKADIEPEFAEVRRAESMQGAASSSHELIANLTPEIGAQRAQAVGMLHMANRLRGLGMHNEATQLSVQADQILQEQEEQALKVAEIKARTAKTVAETEDVGKTSFMREDEHRERLMAKIATAQDPAERERLENELGRMQAKFLKDTAITGTSEFDLLRLGQDPVFARQQLSEIVDTEILRSGLDLARDVISGTSAFDMSLVARAGAGFFGHLEGTFGMELGETKKDFITRVATVQALPARVSALIRHSLTGAQMSAFEIKFLDPFLPKEGDGKTLMLAKVDASEAFASLDVRARSALLSDPEALEKFFKTQISFARRRSAGTPSAGGGNKEETREERRARLLRGG